MDRSHFLQPTHESSSSWQPNVSRWLETKKNVEGETRLSASANLYHSSTLVFHITTTFQPLSKSKSGTKKICKFLDHNMAGTSRNETSTSLTKISTGNPLASKYSQRSPDWGKISPILATSAMPQSVMWPTRRTLSQQCRSELRHLKWRVITVWLRNSAQQERQEVGLYEQWKIYSSFMNVYFKGW